MSTINRTEQMIESSLREVVELVLIATDGTAATGFGTELGDRIRKEASTLARALDDAGLLAAHATAAVAEVIRLREALEVWRGKVKDIPYDGEAITAYITRILEGEA